MISSHVVETIILYKLGKQTKKSQAFFAVLVAKSEIFFEAQVKFFSSLPT